MKNTIVLLLFMGVFFSACNNGEQTNSTAKDSTATVTVDPVKDWKFGVALWTFHTFNFAEAIDKVDSAGLVYIEPNTFHKAGPELKDTLIGKLSPAGLGKLKELIGKKGLQLASIYIAGDSTLATWVHQFDIAKELGASFVTAEPPLNMWDAINSLAGVYGMKVAIHEHWKGISRYWHPDSVLAAIKNHPNFGACADLGHWPKSGIDPVEAVKKLSGHIIAVHLKDIAAMNDPTLKDVPVGTGIVKFPEVFAELKKQGFTGYIYIERDAEDLPSNLPSVMQTVTYYNEQVNKLKN